MTPAPIILLEKRKIGEPCGVAGCGKPTLARSMCSAHYNRWRNNGDYTKTRKPANGTTMAFVADAATYAGDDCLIWPFGRGGNGYGKTTRSDGSRIVASRAVCEAAHGPPPSPLHQAAHSCGNGHGGCVNPRHLRWATPVENRADSICHGTANRGERHGNVKLTASDVQGIRRLLSTGVPQMRVGELFGVSQTTVGEIKRGKTWGWLEGASDEHL